MRTTNRWTLEQSPIGGGFGAVTDEGYGVSYVVVGEDKGMGRKGCGCGREAAWILSASLVQYRLGKFQADLYEERMNHFGWFMRSCLYCSGKICVLLEG